MLEQRAGMIEPAYQQAGGPQAANDDASTLHRRKLATSDGLLKPVKISSFQPKRAFQLKWSARRDLNAQASGSKPAGCPRGSRRSERPLPTHCGHAADV
jgi:hypothetical protein